MPTSDTRHRVEIPRSLYQALNQAAADATMPTNVLITTWLYQMLEARRPDLPSRDPYRSGIEQYERRPRRAGELPDHAPPATLLKAGEDDEDLLAPAAATPPSATLTTVRSQPQEGGILPLIDHPSAQC